MSLRLDDEGRTILYEYGTPHDPPLTIQREPDGSLLLGDGWDCLEIPAGAVAVLREFLAGVPAEAPLPVDGHPVAVPPAGRLPFPLPEGVEFVPLPPGPNRDAPCSDPLATIRGEAERIREAAGRPPAQPIYTVPAGLDLDVRAEFDRLAADTGGRVVTRRLDPDGPVDVVTGLGMESDASLRARILAELAGEREPKP